MFEPLLDSIKWERLPSYLHFFLQEKKNRVVNGRSKLKDSMADKRAHLDESKLFQEFRTQV